MFRANALVVLAIFALTACGLRDVQPEIGPSTDAPTARALTSEGNGPFVIPTHLTFSSPNARPKMLLVGPDLYLQGGECSGTRLVTTFSRLHGPYPFFVFTVTPHVKGRCTVVFYKKDSPEGTALHVTVN